MASNDYFNLLNNITLSDVLIKDIFSRYNILNETENFIEHTVRDGDTLLKISDRYYGSKRYWWVISLYNDIIDPLYGIALSENELRDYVFKYMDEEAESGETYADLYTQFETENEKKRTIKILSPELLEDFLKQFSDEIAKIENT
jgi:hypothetical protein